MTGISRVVGVQLATSSVSVAVITRRVNGSCIASTATFTSRLPDDKRAADLAGVIDHVVCAAELAVVGPSTAGPCDDLRRAVLAALRARGVPVSTVSATEPTTDFTDLWPTVRITTAGEVTALGLAHSGALQLGWPVPAKEPAA